MDSIEKLVYTLEKRGVALEVVDDALKFRAPKGLLSGDDIATMKARKTELVEYLRAKNASLDCDKEHRYDPFPLTDMQQAYVMGATDAYRFGGTCCHGYMEIAVPHVDLDRIERAWGKVIHKHDSLHSVVDAAGFQYVLKTYEVEGFNGRSFSTERAYQAAIGRSRRQLDHKPYGCGTAKHADLHVNACEETGEATLHLSIDLMICDFLSITIVLRDLAAFYDDERRIVDEPRLLFRDSVIRAQRAVSPQQKEQDAAFWQDRVENLPGHPELPLLKDADTRHGVRFDRSHMVLSRTAWASLRNHASSQGVTPSVALLTLYGATLAEWSSQRRFSINMTTLNRPTDDERALAVVGDYTSMVLAEMDCEVSRSFVDVCHRTQERLWTDLSHLQTGGVAMLREFSRRRRMQQASDLMPIVFTSSVGMGVETDFGTARGLFEESRIRGGISQTPQVWIDCQAMEWNGELVINWDVRRGVFPEGMIEEAFRLFESCTRQAAEQEAFWSRPLGDRFSFELPPKRSACNSVQRSGAPLTLPAAFCEQAAIRPEAPAVTTQGKSYTYRQLFRDASYLAHQLPETGSVAIMIPKGYEQVVAAVGAALAGVCYIPIDPDQPIARRDTIIADAQVSVILASAAHPLEDVPAGVTVLPVEGDIDRLVPLPSSVDPDQLAYIIYTSGSTGTPKGVAMSHRAAMNTISDINARIGANESDVVIGLANLTFDLSVYDIFGTLSFGGTLALPDPQEGANPLHWARIIERENVTIWNSVPQQLQMLSNCLDDASAPDASSLRVALLSGDWIPVGLPDEIRFKIAGLQLLSLGGATEAGIWSVYHAIDVVAPDAPSIPYGRPLSNQQMDVVDTALRSRPTWVPGEIIIMGRSLAQGYAGNPELTAEKFCMRNGVRCYLTGDIGRYLGNGEIEFLGRMDQQVKLLGYRVELGEVEAALVSSELVGEGAAVVVGEDKRLCAAVVPAVRPSSSREDLTALLAGVEEDGLASSSLPWEKLDAYRKKVDETALCAIAALLSHAVQQRTFTSDDAIAALQVRDTYRNLVKRWLAALVARGWAIRSEDRFTLGEKEWGWDTDDRWEQLRNVGVEAGYREELVEYLRLSCQSLPSLLKGEKQALSLLFPQGDTHIAQAAYGKNPPAEFLNTLLAKLALRLSDRNQAMRVLEIGAGSGGSSDALIAALDGHCKRYWYTDVSPFFFQEARERYGQREWIQYARLDINENFLEQGFDQNSFDLVFAANVLHNASHIEEALSRIKGLIAPGGALVFIEATVERPSMMASIDFQKSLNAGFTDDRARFGSPFLSAAQWNEKCRAAGYDEVACLPSQQLRDALCQGLFVAQAKGARARFTGEEIKEQVSGILPSYMVPDIIRVLDELPTTKNGKVDRKRLTAECERMCASAATSIAESMEEGSLEARIAHAFEEVLECRGVGPDDDFFNLGGDSLQVTRLIGVLRKSIPEANRCEWERLLRGVMRNPTVSGIAQTITGGRKQGQASGKQGCYVALNKASDEGKLVFFHEGTGTLNAYSHLLNLIGERTPAWGFQCDDRAAYEAMDAHTLIQDLGARYGEILEQREDPAKLTLVGFCMGGMIAMESARYLLERGLSVKRLIIISGYGYPFIVDDDILIEFLFAQQKHADVQALGYDSESLFDLVTASLKRDPTHLAVGSADQEAPAWLQTLKCTPQEQRLRNIVSYATDDEAGIASLVAQYPFFSKCTTAVSLHRPEPYFGDVTYLEVADQENGFTVLGNSARDFWEDLVLGDLSIHRISGRHFTCLSNQYVEDVAAKAGLL